MMKSRKKIIVTIISVLAVATLGIAVFFIFFKPNTSIDTVYSQSSYVIDVEDLSAMAGFADYVFVGTVLSNAGTHYNNGIAPSEKDDHIFALPYTDYVVKVIENIKGSLKTDTELKITKSGGLSEKGDSVYIPENDVLPEEGRIYVFFANANVDGGILVSGMNSNLEIADALVKEGNISYSDSKVYKEAAEAVKNQKTFERERFRSVFESE